MTITTTLTDIPDSSPKDWVSTALDAVAQTSIDAISVSGFCTAAKISRPTFYSRFGNVEGLLAEVWLQRGQSWLDSLLSPQFIADAHSRSLAQILCVARRKPEINEVVAPTVKNWWAQISQAKSLTCSSWLVANRLGTLLVHSVDPGVHVIGQIDPVIYSMIDSGKPTTSDLVDTSPPIVLTSPRTENVLLEAAIAVIASSGYKNASMSRIGRQIRITTGAIYPHFNSVDDLLLAAFGESQRHIVNQNAAVWQERGFTARNFGKFIIAGLLSERSTWRNLRLETYLAAPESQRLATIAYESMAEARTSLHDALSIADVPSDLKPVLHYLFHTLGVGFGVLHQIVDGVDRLHHVAMAERLGAALNNSAQ